MVSLLVFASVLVLMTLGMPIAMSLLLATTAGMLVAGYDLILIPQNMVSSVKSIELTAIPFFILAAALMDQLGITRKIFDFAQALVGSLRGGLAHANVVAGFIFSGISGAAVADAAALAAISSKEMPKAGYTREFAAATVLAVSTLGPIIPPSIMMVVYAITANVSIARLFVAGIMPGVLIAALLMALIAFLTHYRFTPSPEPSRFSWRVLGRATKGALLALFAPLVIMRGMASGWATPTEAAVLAVGYALLVGLVQRNLTFKIIAAALRETTEATALILYVIAVSSGLSYVFVAEGTASQIAGLMTSMSIGPVSFLLISNLLLLVLGCLVETLPAMLLAVPLLLPTALALGVDPTHFGVLVIFNLLIGYMHPPMGIGLFVLMAITKVEFGRLVKATLPFVAVLMVALLLLTFVPQITMWLPDLLLPLPGKPLTSMNPNLPNFKVAADIGGTFTDIALLMEDGAIATEKVPSTPDDYGRAIVQGMAALLGSLGLRAQDVAEVLHGCTVATNAILEGRGAHRPDHHARFRDVLELRRIRVPRLYDPLYVKPEPLAARELRMEVTERLAADGSVVVPLDEDEVREAVLFLKSQGIQALAVCCLHSYLNPAHEWRIGEIVREIMPDVFLTLSCDILPEIREYERTSTAVINSYVGPPVASYVRALAGSLQAAGVPGRLLVMQSTGGILDAEESVARMPARIVECGPAAGVIGAAFQAQCSGYADVITFDMGGTTAKAAMIEGGRIIRTDEYEVGGGISLSSRLVKGGGYALKLPVIDISEVGAGGGSLVWIDRARAQVGPRSAGAVPGPACYGAGNEQATVTDANVVLGYLNPQALAGGTVPIDHALARAAVQRTVAEPLACGAEDAAWSVYVVAAASMMRAVKAVSTYRGRDPRDCVLMAFGGNGGVFAVELARQLQMKRVLVPPAAGVFSALGLSVAPIEFSQTQAFLQPVRGVDPAALAARLEETARKVAQTLGQASAGIVLRRVAALRYIGQAFELQVPVPEGAVTAGTLAQLSEAFEAEHEKTYGHRFADNEGVEIVAIEVTGTVAGQARPGQVTARARAMAAVPARAAYFGPERGAHQVQVITRAALGATPRRGPFIVEEYEGTTVIPPDAVAFLDAASNIVIDIDLDGSR